jgi:pantoate--beta-alanine ligase
MKTVSTISETRELISAWRRAGECIAFVPTMGNLHGGHLELVKRARERAQRVVVSIFVNPLQFGTSEDLASYPHTPEQDARHLGDLDVDLLFLPTEREIYPNGREDITTVEVPVLSDMLCGASRPGHFRGVTTVVARLFNIVQPDVALFGEKDYQQLTVLRRMVSDLCMPVEMVGVPTVREKDGLAMSSRNGYLTAEERSKAPLLYQVLLALGEQLSEGCRDFGALENEGMQRLEQDGFHPEYLAVRRASDLEVPAEGERELVILAAARLGKARLIDNLLISL